MTKMIKCNPYFMIIQLQKFIVHSTPKFREYEKRSLTVIINLVNNIYFLVMNSK